MRDVRRTRLDPTYKELKQTQDFSSPINRTRLDPTYKELKQSLPCIQLYLLYSLDPTYKELKPISWQFLYIQVLDV